MWWENVHKLVVNGNKTRVHICSYKAIPISQKKVHLYGSVRKRMSFLSKYVPYARYQVKRSGDVI